MEIGPGNHLKLDINEISDYSLTFETAGTNGAIIFEGTLVNNQSTYLKGKYYFDIFVKRIPNFIIIRNMGSNNIIDIKLTKKVYKDE